MRRIRCTSIVGFTAFGLAVGAAPAVLEAQDIGLPVGDAAPAVVLEDLDGNPVDLGRYIGTRPVLIEFWAEWCGQCKALQPRLDAAHEKYGEDVEFIYVAVAVNQTPRSIRRHLERNPKPGRMLWDASGEATRAYRAPTTSYVVIVDADGTVAYTGSGGGQPIDTALARLLQRTGP